MRGALARLVYPTYMRVGYALMNRRALSLMRLGLHPHVKFELPPNFPEGQTFRGPHEVLRLLDSMLTEFSEMHITPERFAVRDRDAVVALISERFQGSDSGLTVTQRAAHVWRFRYGRIVGMTVYNDQREALAATGLSGGSGARASSSPGH